MAWSLLNHMVADKVEELLKAHDDDYPPDVKRWYTREQAAAIIHAAIWAYSVREGSTAGCYAASNLFDALGLKWQCFDEKTAEWAQNAYTANLRVRGWGEVFDLGQHGEGDGSKSLQRGDSDA
jgi:hypothetical protein